MKDVVKHAVKHIVKQSKTPAAESAPETASFERTPKAMLLGAVLVLLGGVLWGINATVSKLLMADYHADPLWIACVRELAAGALFLACAGVRTPKLLAGAVRDRRSYPMLLFAALTFVSLLERGFPFWGAFAATLAAMLALAFAIERGVLRHLVNRPPITLFMATLGLSCLIEGFAQALWACECDARGRWGFETAAYPQRGRLAQALAVALGVATGPIAAGAVAAGKKGAAIGQAVDAVRVQALAATLNKPPL